ncbi:MAG: hypothetical protein ACYDG2_18120 [Ruminiclostridium sp.]
MSENKGFLRGGFGGSDDHIIWIIIILIIIFCCFCGDRGHDC